MEMQRENCDRCNCPTNGRTIMSMFNKDVLCNVCKETERNHPDYKRAADTEAFEVLNGNNNFEGIGLPNDLKVEAAGREAIFKYGSTLKNLGNG